LLAYTVLPFLYEFQGARLIKTNIDQLCLKVAWILDLLMIRLGLNKTQWLLQQVQKEFVFDLFVPVECILDHEVGVIAQDQVSQLHRGKSEWLAFLLVIWCRGFLLLEEVVYYIFYVCLVQLKDALVDHVGAVLLQAQLVKVGQDKTWDVLLKTVGELLILRLLQHLLYDIVSIAVLRQCQKVLSNLIVKQVFKVLEILELLGWLFADLGSLSLGAVKNLYHLFHYYNSIVVVWDATEDVIWVLGDVVNLLE
jgi:hypothetical protein